MSNGEQLLREARKLASTRPAAALLGIVVVAAALAAERADARVLLPVQRCQVAKLTAAAAELRARLLCARGRGSALDDTPCDAAAAERRTVAFARAERAAACTALGDAAAVGGRVADGERAIRYASILSDDPAAKRCAARQLTLAARAAWARARAAIAQQRTGDDARFLAAVELQRASFDRAYARLVRTPDCWSAAMVSPQDYDERIGGAVDRLRLETCPSCGAACPCWSTGELDASLPPGALDVLGGAVCDQNGTGVLSADRCTVPAIGREQPRGGVNVAGGLCVRWQQDADSDGDGACDTSPLVVRVDRFAQATCAAALQASRLRRASCSPASSPRRIEAIPGPDGRVRAVGIREWMAVGSKLGVVLPRDAAAGAGPLPVPGCPLGTDGACRLPIAVAYVGDSDWVVGSRSTGSPDGAYEILALGPEGQVVPLRPGENATVRRAVRVGPGPLFASLLDRGDRTVAAVWIGADAQYQELPAGGFVPAPVPRGSDAQQRIVGWAEEERLPVLWTRSGDGYRIETLPLLAGDVIGSASGIDAGVAAGSSGGHAVVWELGDERIRVRELPTPPEGSGCDVAATSRGRVLGVCTRLDGRLIGVVWARSSDGSDEWRDVHLLQPWPGDDGVYIDGFNGDLVAGLSVFVFQGQGVASNVVWRLPPATLP